MDLGERVVHCEAQMVRVFQIQLIGQALCDIFILHVPAELQGHPRVLQVSGTFNSDQTLLNSFGIFEPDDVTLLDCCGGLRPPEV